jgi:hypothetical protein
VQVGPAYAARPDRYQRVARTEHGFRDVFHNEDTTSGNGGTHDGETTETVRRALTDWSRQHDTARMAIDLSLSPELEQIRDRVTRHR